MSDSEQKIVWILGAGFSKFLGAPLLHELLTDRSAARIATIYGPRMTMHLELGAAAVQRVPQIYAAGFDMEWRNPEEFLERFDLALEQPSAAEVLRAWSMNAIRQGKHGLIGNVSMADHRTDIVRVLAAECCLFLRDANTALERWSPYLAWARSLQRNDTIITFNYDRVLEHVAAQGNISIPIPSELDYKATGPIALKMHGSVDWLLDHGHIRRAEGTGLAEPNEAALFCKAEEIAIATPGPPKYRMTKPIDPEKQGGPLALIWDRASRELDQADAVVMVGYRLPETDAYSKQWFVDALRSRIKFFHQHYSDRGGRMLPVHTVLGADRQHPHAVRLQGLLTAIDPWIDHVPWSMGAEDFLGLVSRAALLTPPTPRR